MKPYMIFSLLVLSVLITKAFLIENNIEEKNQVIIEFLKNDNGVLEYCESCYKAHGRKFEGIELNIIPGSPRNAGIKYDFENLNCENMGIDSFSYDCSQISELTKTIYQLIDEDSIGNHLVSVALNELNYNFSPLSTRIVKLKNEQFYFLEIHCRSWQIELLESLGKKSRKTGQVIGFHLLLDENNSSVIWNSESNFHYN